jgi:hypothetical protein
MLKSLIGVGRKFGPLELAAGCLLSVLVLAQGFAAQKPGQEGEAGVQQESKQKTKASEKLNRQKEAEKEKKERERERERRESKMSSEQVNKPPKGVESRPAPVTPPPTGWNLPAGAKR